MNGIEVLENGQIGNIITQLCHNPVGERYYVEQWDTQQDNKQPSCTEFSYQRVGGRTKKEALALANEEYRRLTSE